MKQLARFAVNASEKIASYQVVASAFIVVVVGVIIAYGIVMRYAFRQGIGWAWELPGLLFLLITSLGLAYAQVKNKHIHVDILVLKLPKRAQNIVKAFGHLVFFAFCIILLRALVGKLMSDWIVRSEVARVPMAPFEIILIIGIVILALRILVDTGKQLVEFSHKPGEIGK